MRSILAVTAAPDDRPSTSTLRVIVEELQSRPDVRAEIWLLRAAPEDDVWGSPRVVDELRTWRPAALLESLRVPVLPDLLRGLRLKWWLYQLEPDLVILDDGLGGRLFDGRPFGRRRRPVMAVRTNPDHPRHQTWEPAPLNAADIVLQLPGTEPGPVSGQRMDAAHVREYPDAGRLGRDEARTSTRATLAVPGDAVLITGWGNDGWLDGPDLFVRGLWALEQRHGIAAHGLWLGLGSDPEEVRRLHVEAERCGLSGRFHQRSADTVAARCCGDAAFLPYRDAGDPFALTEAVVSGLGIATFITADVHDPMVIEVPPLDVEAAADALAELLGRDRSVEAERARRRLDVGGWVDSLLDLAATLR